jgi:hypothetical protein
VQWFGSEYFYQMDKFLSEAGTLFGKRTTLSSNVDAPIEAHNLTIAPKDTDFAK